MEKHFSSRVETEHFQHTFTSTLTMVTLIVSFMKVWCVHFIVTSPTALWFFGFFLVFVMTAAVPVATATWHSRCTPHRRRWLSTSLQHQLYLVPHQRPSWSTSTSDVIRCTAPVVECVTPAPAITSRPLSQCTRRSRLSWTTSRQHQQDVPHLHLSWSTCAGTRSAPRTCACHGVRRSSTSNVRCTCTCRGPHRAYTSKCYAALAPAVEYIAPAPTVFAALASWSTPRRLQQCTLHLHLSWTTSRRSRGRVRQSRASGVLRGCSACCVCATPAPVVECIRLAPAVNLQRGPHQLQLWSTSLRRRR